MDLNAFDQIDIYRKHFMDIAFWQPYVHLAMKKAGLTCQEVRGGIAGTCPTFIVDELYVVKFFGRLFNGEAAYRAELFANQLLKPGAGVPAPGLVAQGKLEEKSCEWSWPFLVFEYLNGISVGEAWNLLSVDSRIDIAVELGRIIRCLHSIPLAGNSVFQSDWRSYQQFLERQKKYCRMKYKDSNVLPEHLFHQLDSFLLPIESLLDITSSPHLIHADLTRDHLLGTVKDRKWISLGIIDFGDAIVGNLYYELVALQFDLFHNEKVLLKKFLNHYGIEKNLLENFSIRMMNMTFLHQFGEGILAFLFHRFPNLQQVNTLENLAEDLWGVEN